MKIITSKFSFYSTAEEVSEGINLKGMTALITGGASGIGIETARVLALRGAAVTLAVRNMDTGKAIAESIKKESGNAEIDIVFLELANLESISNLVNNWKKPLHLLINNAGIMATPEERTPSGIEIQFATNHLGHFALANGLRKFLIDAGNARIVNVSSTGHLFSPVVFDDINFLFRPYDPFLAYGQSKAAVNLFAVAATEKWNQFDIYANSLNPGAIATNLQKHVGNVLRSPPNLHKSAAQGAATTVFVATSPLLEGIGGKYFNDSNQANPVSQRPADPANMTNSVAPYSLDKANAERLWELSIELVTRDLQASQRIGWF